jgi:two-component system response regulator RegA
VLIEAVQSVLVVDDDLAVVASFERALRSQRRVYVATNASQAIELGAAKRPNLAIIDMKLGNGFGTEVIRVLREHSPETVTVLLSGYLTVDATVEAVRAGAQHVMAKPVGPRELLLRVAGRTSSESLDTPSLAHAEREHIARVLTDCNGNISEAARRLRIHRTSLRRKLTRRTAEG